MILPHVKITELLLEVDEWTGFTRHFAPEIGRPGQGQKPVADHDPGRRDQPGPDQDGGIVPRHDLRQAGLAASLAHPRRNLFGALAELVNAQFPTSLRRALGRRHHVIVGRPELPHRQQGREHRPHQPEIRQQPRADVLHPHLRPVRAVPHQGRERRRARLDLRARRPAVPRIRPAIEEHYTDTAASPITSSP